MNFEIKGATAPKHQTKHPSGTQLAKGWRPHSLLSQIRPKEVPCLDLGTLGDSDDEDCYVPASKGYPRFGPPDSSSTISWGSPLNTPYAQHFVTQQQTEADLKIVPENLPSPSNKFKLKYQQYEEEMKQSYKKYSGRAAEKNETQKNTQRRNQSKQEIEDPERKTDLDITPLDEMNHMEPFYTSKPYSAPRSMRKQEAEDLAAERRKQAVVEQVMIDHLSRAVISDPEQNTYSGLVDNIPQHLLSAPLRFRKRTLHETKIKTSSAVTENALSNKLRFDARIICRNGRDASRELIGFFFEHDKSLTIYEYRQFGKNRTNALPFIQKGSYLHQCGHRKGNTYELGDFYPGANITFLVAEHQTLPDSVKKSTFLKIRITTIDNEAMKSLKACYEENMDGLSAYRNEDSSVLLAVQDVMKEKLKNRSIQTLTRLGKYFRQLDTNGNGILRKTEIKQALKTFHLEVSEKIFESLWLMLDENNKEELDYLTFIHAVIGEMSEYRKSFVRKAFMKLDPNKSGIISMVDLRKFYCVRKHPQVMDGISEENLKSAFFETLEKACSNPKEVSYCEFEDYYEGLSIEIQNDEDFINILRNSWGI